MKKYGFTLSELIVAATIVGISAAMIVPAVNKFTPDTKKVTVLKYNNLINNAIVNYFSGPLYQPREGCSGIDCYQDNNNDSTFATYLLEELDTKYNGNQGKAPDGVNIIIAEPDEGGSYTVTLDTKPISPCTTTYSNNNTDFSKIDSFKLKINNDGEILPDDALTAAFFQNQYNMSSKDSDLKKAKELLSQYD